MGYFHVLVVSTVLFSIPIPVRSQTSEQSTSGSEAQSSILAPEAKPSSLDPAIPEIIPDQALVLIIRERAEPTAWNVVISIDDAKIVSLPNKAYSWAMLQEGSHTLKAKWPLLSGQKDCHITFVVSSNSTNYVEITGVTQLAGVQPGGGYIWKTGSGAQVVEPTYGDSLILTLCRYVPPIK